MTSQAPNHIKTIVGWNIRLARDSNGLTQRQLAIHLGLDSRAISRWETGRVLPSTLNLVALAARLQRDVAWFYTDHEQQAAA